MISSGAATEHGPVVLAGIIVFELVGGALIGAAAGFGGAWIMRRVALPASGLYPIAVLCLALLGYGAAAGVHTDRHFGFYLLAEHLPAQARRVLDLLRPLLMAAVGALIAGWGAVLLLDGLDIKIAGAAMPQSINYLPLSIGGALICVFALNKAWLVLQPARTQGA